MSAELLDGKKLAKKIQAKLIEEVNELHARDIFPQITALYSTNDEAKRINLNKDFHIIIAEKQYKGRGRLGKKWSSPDLGNIYMTVCTEKDFSYMPLSLVIGVICKKGIEKFINNNDIELKWPNDILYNNKKVGGVLVEKEVIKESTRTIIGIGINLNIKNYRKNKLI